MIYLQNPPNERSVEHNLKRRNDVRIALGAIVLLLVSACADYPPTPLAVPKVAANPAPIPSAKFDSFDNKTVISSGTACAGFLFPNLQKLCLAIIYTVPGNMTLEEFKAMTLQERKSVISERFADWSYHGEDWIFAEKIVAKVGEKKYVVSGPLSNRKVVSGDYILEWVRYPVVQGTEAYEYFKLTQDNPNLEVQFRVFGQSHYVDF